MTRIVCPNCKSTLKVDDDQRGAEVYCPRCQALLRVPAGAPNPEAAVAEGEEEYEERPRRKSFKSKRRESDGSVFKWVIGAVALVLVSFAGCCAVWIFRFNQVAKDFGKDLEKFVAKHEAELKARTLVVTAGQVLDDFKKDAATAEQKYSNKYLELRGVVERVGKNGEEVPFVILHGGDASAKIKIECFFDVDDEDEAQIKRLRPGQTITVRGDFNGRVSNVQLQGCELVK